MKYLYLIGVLTLFLFGCSDYQRVLKGDDNELKFKRAEEYFAKKDYFRALSLYEDLIPLFRGTERAETVNFHYAETNYGLGYYTSAAYYFKRFATVFSTSKLAPKALFMSGYTNYILSPAASLAQEDTQKAIDAMQLFVNTYPNHELVDSSHVLIDKLQLKLAEKAYQNAFLYYKIGKFKAANVALQNVLKDYPELAKKEEAMYYILKARYELTVNSVSEKKLDRCLNTIEAYHNFVDAYGDSSKKREIENIFKKMIDLKGQLSASGAM